MRISDWSSDVCSSDLRDRIRITDRDECREFGASVFDQFSRIDQERSLGAEKEHRALGVCRIQILNKEVASHEPAIIRAHRFAVNLGNQCCLVRIDPVLDSTNSAKPPALIGPLISTKFSNSPSFSQNLRLSKLKLLL